MTAYPPVTGNEPCRQVPADVFFPEIGDDSRDLARVTDLCRGCPILLPCLAWAVKHERHGVWGGTTPRQRAEMRRLGNRRRAA